jgi:hypothetical protein
MWTLGLRPRKKLAKILQFYLPNGSDPDPTWPKSSGYIRPDPDPQHCYTDLTVVCSPGAALTLLSIDVELVDVLQAVVGEADVGPRVEGRHGGVPHAVSSTLPFKWTVSRVRFQKF